MRYLQLVTICLFLCSCAKIMEGQDPQTCEDGIDNDIDGRTDCDDDGCAASTYCVNKAREKAALEEELKRKQMAAKKPIPSQPIQGPLFDVSGLTVKREHNGNDVNLSEAESYCQSLNFMGFSDWRLPDQNEAVKIVESGELKEQVSHVMWTSTRKGAKQAIIVGVSGAVNELGIQYRGQCRARCVRGSVVR